MSMTLPHLYPTLSDPGQSSAKTLPRTTRPKNDFSQKPCLRAPSLSRPSFLTCPSLYLDSSPSVSRSHLRRPRHFEVTRQSRQGSTRFHQSWSIRTWFLHPWDLSPYWNRLRQGLPTDGCWEGRRLSRRPPGVLQVGWKMV